MNVLFLLGAGISKDALPLAHDLGGTVFSRRTVDGRVFFRHSGGRYYLGTAGDASCDWQRWTGRVVAFLHFLRERLAYDEWNYEGLYFACQQIHDTVHEYENPLLEPFVQECAEWVEGAWPDQSSLEELGAGLNRDFYEEHAGSVEFWSPGNPLFPDPDDVVSADDVKASGGQLKLVLERPRPF
jgi:hypothetical protein